jgi:hypothetical protein
MRFVDTVAKTPLKRNEERKMTTHAPISQADRSLLPRSLLGRRARTYCANWTYRVGQKVEYYGDTAIVISRQCSAMGREIYDVRIDCAERRVEPSLVPP